MSRPRALDLFCGGGGAALGMIEAGFDVTGVDIEPRHAKVYPGTFVCGDATRPPFDPMDFDFVWASPPCQAFSRARNGQSRSDVNLIPETRALLDGHPCTVIENVPEAPIRADVVLTGGMVGLPRLVRRRHFETSFAMLTPPVALDRPDPVDLVTVNKSGGMGKSQRELRRRLGLKPLSFPKALAAEAMGGLPLDWTHAQIGEAVPPAYARLIAESALRLMASPVPA